MKALRRLPFLLVAAVSLLAGLWGGLLRMSWQLPLPTEHANWITFHGPLMVAGFFGTLIGVERAAALGRRWGWLAPAFSGAGAVCVAAGGLGPAGPALATAGALLLLATTWAAGRRRPGAPLRWMLAGAAALVAGNGLWLLGLPIPRSVVFWIAFFVLTIAGERLELARIRPRSRGATLLFQGAAALLAAGCLLSLLDPAWGQRLAGAASVALAGWLLVHDVARLTVRSRGVARFSAVALLVAYGWLAIGGAMLAAAAPLRAGLSYDGALHTIFVGFTFGMVIGHAPIVIPAVLGRPGTFHPSAYAPLLMLEASLALRIAGDLLEHPPIRQWGGMLSTISLLLFLAQTAWSVRAARRSTS